MTITRESLRIGHAAALFVAVGVASVLAAGPAAAANAIDIVGATPTTIGANYSCDPSAGVVSAKAMVGDPTAERPAALGAQYTVVCDGAPQTAEIPLTVAPGEAPPRPSALVQVRVALVDRNDIVVSGQAKVIPLQS